MDTRITSSDKQKMLAARSLLKQGDYVKAHKILVAIDNPDARRWVGKIVKKHPELQKTMWQRIRNLVLASMLMALFIIGVVLAVDTIQTNAAYEIYLSQTALERYCLMVVGGNAADCENWSRQQTEYDQDHVKVCRLRHDVWLNPGLFGRCLNSN